MAMLGTELSLQLAPCQPTLWRLSSPPLPREGPSCDLAAPLSRDSGSDGPAAPQDAQPLPRPGPS